MRYHGISKLQVPVILPELLSHGNAWLVACDCLHVDFACAPTAKSTDSFQNNRFLIMAT